MLQIQLNPLYVEILEDLENNLKCLYTDNETPIPVLRVVVTGRVARLHCERDIPNAAFTQTTADICIEPLDNATVLTLPQIAKIVERLVAQYQVPAPEEWSFYYGASFTWKKANFHLSVENKQMEPRNSIDIKINAQGVVLFNPDVKFENKTQEELFKAKKISIPNITLFAIAYQKHTIKASKKHFLRLLGFSLKIVIKSEPEQYQLTEYTAACWAKLINESASLYHEVKTHLAANQENNITPAEFSNFEDKIKRIHPELALSNEQGESRAMRESLPSKNKTYAELASLNNVIPHLTTPIPHAKEFEKELEEKEVEKQYLKMRHTEIKDYKEQLTGHFYRLMTLYNFYCAEKNEAEQFYLDHDETELYIELTHEEKYFGIPGVMFAMDQKPREYNSVKVLIEAIEKSQNDVEVQRNDLKKNLAAIKEKKAAVQLAQEKRKEEILKQAKEQQKVNHPSHAAKSHNENSNITVQVDKDNQIVNLMLARFCDKFVSQFKAWDKKVPLGQELVFIKALSKSFTTEYRTVFTTSEQKAKFFAHLKTHVLATHGNINEVPEIIRQDILKNILYYYEINVREYIKKDHNCRAYIANSFDAFLFAELFSPEVKQLNTSGDVIAQMFNQWQQNAREVTEIFILSHRYSDDEQTYKMLNDEYQKMQAQGLFAENRLGLRTAAHKGESPNKRVVFKYSRDNFVIDPALVKLFYDPIHRGRLLKFENSNQNIILFKDIVTKTVLELLDNYLIHSKKFTPYSNEFIHNQVLSYIDELILTNRGTDNRLLTLRRFCEQQRATIYNLHEETYKKLTLISKEFTPYRVFAALFDTQDVKKDVKDDNKIIQLAMRRAQTQKNISFDSMGYKDFCEDDTSLVHFTPTLLIYIETLAEIWPYVFNQEFQLLGYNKVVSLKTFRYFEKVVQILANVPANERKSYNKFIPIPATSKLAMYNNNKGEVFWAVFDAIHRYYQITQTPLNKIESVQKLIIDLCSKQVSQEQALKNDTSGPAKLQNKK